MKTRLLLVAVTVMSAATLTELNATITITRQPTNQWVSLNAHVTNLVTVSSTAPPITYRWHGPSGELLTGETNRSPVTLSLVLPSIQASQAGGYYVVLSDTNFGPVQSDTTTITVDPTFIKLTEGPVVTEVASSEDARWWDPDGDGWLDLFISHLGGDSGAALPSFFISNADGTFEKITTNAIAQARKRGLASAVGDFDNDGDDDLYYSGNAHPGSNEPKCDLFRNDGAGRFTAVTGPWQSDVDLTIDCTFVDYDRDGLLDIFVVNGHKATPCLYRQTPAGTFVKQTATQVGSVMIAPPESYNAGWADYDNDGDPDLWFENAQGYSRLHRNDGHGFFSLDTPTSFGQSLAGGIGSWGDCDNDGFLDLFVGGYSETGTPANALYRNLGGSDFTNVAAGAGVGLTMNGYASAWGDYDNDGWLDLFVSRWLLTGTDSTKVLFRNRGDGTFESIDVGSPIRDGRQPITVTWVDYDNDGFLDLFLGCGEPVERDHLYRNNARGLGNSNHWFKVKLNGQASNRSSIGAKIHVQATIAGKESWQVREINGNGHSVGGPGLVAHFGLGDSVQATTVRIEWPSGNVQELTDVPAGQAGQAALTITEQVFITPVRPSSSLGGAVTLTSQRGGATSWQWYHDGVALEGQTGQTLALSKITTNDAGRYSVVVDTGSGTFTNYVYLLVDTQFERIEMGDTAASWGCAWGDYDNDGYPDLFVGEGVGTPGATAGLYRNDGEGALIRVTPAEAGDIVDLVRTWQCGAWADYDNDGHLDLMVTDNPLEGEPRPALWRNLGNGHFADATDAGSFASDRPCTAPIWGDFNRDGFLDLAVANAWDDTAQPDWSRNLLYFSQGDGTFRKETSGDFVNARAVVWGGSAGDMDGDGDLDMLLGTDTGISLFENDGVGGLRRVTVGVPSEGTPCGTSSWADYDNDGRLDVFVTVYNDTSLLLHNEGSGQWTEIRLGAGRQTTAGMWADYDNDGDLDLFISRGQGITTTNLLFANSGDGTFTQVMLGSLANDQGRSAGCACADYDNNGFLDLFVTGHVGYPELLYRNHGNSNHWISFKLVGTASNRSAIGAKVRVYATIFGRTYWQMREIGGGNHHQNDLRPHFGLGDATRATTVRIEWPSGIVQTLTNVPAGQVVTVTEHQAAVPPPAPAFTGVSFAPTGFDLAIAEPTAGIVYVLEGSTDLATWTKLMVRTSTGGTHEWVDERASNQPTRFYRLVVP